MSKIDIIMPQMGESIAEGTLSRWIKKAGETVQRDEPIFEISTDKVDAEIPSPVAGTLAEILVNEGETVAVQTVVARIETEAGVGAATPASAPAPAPQAAAPAPQAAAPKPPAPPPPSTPPVPATASREQVAARGQQAAPVARPAADATGDNGDNGGGDNGGGDSGGAETLEDRLRRRSTPLVRKMAAEHNLDLSAIQGTGLAGRVTKNDILNYIESGQAAPQAPPAPVSPVRAPVPAAPLAPAATAVPAPAHAPAGVEPWPGDRVEPWSRIRKLTAEHMVMSRRVSPHVNTIFEVDYTRVAQLRAKAKKEYAARSVNLTYLAFIAKAVADGLRKHPVVNSAVSGESTIIRREINIGIAVALDWGLIVPVVKRADELSLLGLARAINDLGERARTKKLSPDEVQKGTFTITNPGVFGSLIGTPIINQPQAAILCVGAIEKQPAVITVDGTDTLAIRTRGLLSLAFDHRIVDGADADRFMAEVKKQLQEFPESAV